MICLLILILVVIFASKRHIHWIDREIQKPIVSVIIVFLIAGIVLSSFFALECIITDKAPRWHSFFRLYGLFTQTDSVYSNDSFKTESLLDVILSLLGAVLFSGLMVSAFTNMFSQRIYRIREGIVNYSFKDHIVIIGANSSVLSIINSINIYSRPFQDKTEQRKKLNSKILVVTGKHPGELAYLKNSIKDKVWRNVYFFNNNIMSPIMLDSDFRVLKEHYFNKTGIKYCRRIYIIGDEEPSVNEVENSQILYYLANYLNIEFSSDKEKNEKCNPIDCYIAYSNLDIMFETARNLENPSYKDIMKIIHLIPYDFNLRLASKVWGAGVANDTSYPILKPGNNGVCRICIVGFNTIGAAMLKMAMFKCHFGDGATTSIEVYFTNADYGAVKQFQMNYDLALLEGYIHIDFMEIRSEFDFVERYREFSSDMRRQYTVVLGSDNLDVNVQIAYTLQKMKNKPSLLVNSKLPLLGRNFGDKEGNRLEDIHIFGNLNQAIDFDNLVYTTILLYMCADLAERNKMPSDLIGLSKAEIIRKFERYKSRHFDSKTWQLMTLMESFAASFVDHKTIDRKTILNQQIVAAVLGGFIVRNADDDLSNFEEGHSKCKIVAKLGFDIDRLQAAIDLFNKLQYDASESTN